MINKLSELFKYLKKIGLLLEASLIDEIRIKIAQEVYMVVSGDHPGKIAQNYYGKYSYHKYITDDDGNRITDDDGNTIKPLQIGQKLLLGAPPFSPNTSMNYSQNLVEFIKKHEGLKTKVYDDNYGEPGGYATIGYGHNLGKADTIPLNLILDITESQAEKYLKEDLANAVDAVRNNTHVNLNQHQFDALVSLVFNIGRGAFVNSKLLKNINSGALEEAGKSFIDTKITNKGHINRRVEESKMFLEGIY